MELSEKRKTERGMLDGIKSRFGLGASNGQDADQGRYDSEYDDYGEYGADYDEYAEYGPDYDENADAGGYGSYAQVTTRAANDRAARSRARGTSMPKLVSYDDVRSTTQLPDSLNRDPLPPRHVAAARRSYRGERTMVDSSLPPSLTPEGAAATAAAASRKTRSEGLNSLFEPSEGDGAQASHASHVSRFASDEGSARTARDSARQASSFAAASQAADRLSSSSAHATQVAHGGFDPHNAYNGVGASSFSSTRSCAVLKPASYGEVERIAKILKSGDAVILALRNTPDTLAKRILDFSFGVSSALEANVECVADKVFAITRGNALSETERVNLRNQGVL